MVCERFHIRSWPLFFYQVATCLVIRVVDTGLPINSMIYTPPPTASTCFFCFFCSCITSKHFRGETIFLSISFLFHSFPRTGLRNSCHPARGQLNRENGLSPSPFAREFYLARWVRPHVPSHVNYCPFSTLGLNLVPTRGNSPLSATASVDTIPSSAIESVPNLSGHTVSCVPVAFTAKSLSAQG